MDQDQFRTEMEAKGEEAVRLLLEQGVYGPEKKKMVAQWLGEKQHERERIQLERSDAANAEQLALARNAAADASRAADAAERQARAADAANRHAARANTIAIIAIVIAAASLVISILKPFEHHQNTAPAPKADKEAPSSP